MGLANHPDVRKADADAAKEYGLAYPMGARMMSGNSNNHEQLEQELAEFVGKEDAALLNYGYQGMVSIELEDENFNGSEAGEKRGLIVSRDYLASV